MIDVKLSGYLWFTKRIKFRPRSVISGNLRQFTGHSSRLTWCLAKEKKENEGRGSLEIRELRIVRIKRISQSKWQFTKMTLGLGD